MVKECPNCKGMGKEWLDGDLVEGYIDCSQCLGIKVINDDGTCTSHPNFVPVGVYSISAVGLKYGNSGKCLYCGTPAPGYDDWLRKKHEHDFTKRIPQPEDYPT